MIIINNCKYENTYNYHILNLYNNPHNVKYNTQQDYNNTNTLYQIYPCLTLCGIEEWMFVYYEVMVNIRGVVSLRYMKLRC